MDSICCCDCGIVFGVPAYWREKRMNDGRRFFCPNGHPQAYNGGKSKADLLAEELSRVKQQKAWAEDEAKWQKECRSAAERRAAAALGQVTKLKKRAAGGVCPCCNRSFAALAEHMKKQHPSFTAEAIAGDEIREPVRK